MRSLKEILSATKSLDEDKKEFIGRAYQFAVQIHKGQKRHYSTEPLDVHVTRVGLILAELGLAHETIAAGLLHHSMREGNITREMLAAGFGETVALLVEGATKLRDIKFSEKVRHIESLRKLFVASATDIRILILKLADRLDSMRHLFNNKEHHYRIARETMEIYVPLAYRLGLRKITRELEDLAFSYISPQKYSELEKELKKRRKENELTLEKFRKTLLKNLAKSGIVNAETDMRLKSIFSVYTKMQKRDSDLGKIYDISAIRVHVNTMEDCYRALGVVHGIWRPLPGRIKDYIAFPKPNGYKSLHTTVFTGDGSVVEIQIRTHEMHEQAEFGLASHLAYKERGHGLKDPHYSWFDQFFPGPASTRERSEMAEKFPYIPQWLLNLVNLKSFDSEEESAKHLQSDFFQHRMFIFDSRGDVVDLPVQSTPLDFAYELGAELGDHFQGAKVNGKMVSINTELQNGDIVEIQTKKSAHPTEKWLFYAKTALAKQHIKQYLESASEPFLVRRK